MNRSPLGSCAFAGTDLDIAPARVAELLGFDEVVTNSYEAVAGADHLVRAWPPSTRRRWPPARGLARTLMDWLTWRGYARRRTSPRAAASCRRSATRSCWST